MKSPISKIYLEGQFMWIIVPPLLKMIFVIVMWKVDICINHNKAINFQVNMPIRE